MKPEKALLHTASAVLHKKEAFSDEATSLWSIFRFTPNMKHSLRSIVKTFRLRSTCLSRRNLRSRWRRMKFPPCGSKDGVPVLKAHLRCLHGGKPSWFFHLQWYITCGVCVKILDRVRNAGRGDVSEQWKENNLIINKRWIVAYIEWHQLEWHHLYQLYNRAFSFLLQQAALRLFWRCQKYG